MEASGFDGFMPSLHSLDVSPPTSMITTDGDVIDGHTIKLTLGDNSEVFFSCTQDQLQRLFFLILKVSS